MTGAQAVEKGKRDPAAAYAAVEGPQCCVVCGITNLACLEVAHLDHNPANNASDNLAWLCASHHHMYDRGLYPLPAIRLLRAHWQRTNGWPDGKIRDLPDIIEDVPTGPTWRPNQSVPSYLWSEFAPHWCAICGLENKLLLQAVPLDGDETSTAEENLADLCATHREMFGLGLYRASAIKLLHLHWQHTRGEYDSCLAVGDAADKAVATKRANAARLASEGFDILEAV